MFFAIAALIGGLLITPILYTVSLVSLPFVYLTVRALKSKETNKGSADAISEAIDFVYKATRKRVDKENLESTLSEMKADAAYKKIERERELEAIKHSDELFLSLTEECNAFLAKFTLTENDKFGELRAHLATYQNLIERVVDTASL